MDEREVTQTKAHSTLAEPRMAEPTKVAPTKVAPTKATPTKAEPTKAEPTKAERTQAMLRRTALQLLSHRGYDAVTVAEIAQAAGVSHMTFFRYFPTKEAVVVADLFDPVIAAAVRAQPEHLAPLARAVGGLLAALDDDAARAELRSEEFVRRVTLAASTPSLRGAVRAASQATEDAIAEALVAPAVGAAGVEGGVDGAAARAAAGAVMGAATALLLAWAGAPDPVSDPAEVLRDGLASLVSTTPASPSESQSP